jgi:2-keto-3-deoxy-6-phosphogluconate aldolase
MGRDEHIQWIERTGLIAIVRLDSSAELIPAARAIAAGGVSRKPLVSWVTRL